MPDFPACGDRVIRLDENTPETAIVIEFSRISMRLAASTG
jgi:hypothetical protein